MVPGTYTLITTPTTVNGIQYVGAGAVNSVTGSTSTITFDYPADRQANDVLILVVQQDDNGTHITFPPAGWTTINNSTNAGFWLFAAYQVYSSGTGLTVNTSGIDHVIGQIFGFRGVNTGTVIDGSVATSFTRASGSPNPFNFTNVTTTAANSFVCNVVGHDIDTSTASITWNANSSLTSPVEISDVSTQNGWNGGFSLYGGLKTTAGAVNNATGNYKADSYKKFIGWALKAA